MTTRSLRLAGGLLYRLEMLIVTHEDLDDIEHLTGYQTS